MKKATEGGGRSGLLEQRLVVPHDVAHVFEVIGDPRRDVEWNPKIQHVDTTNGSELRKGTELLISGDFPGSPVMIRVDAYEVDRKISVVGSGPLGLGIETSRTFVDHEAGCEVRLTAKVHAGLVNRAFKGRAEEVMEKELAKWSGWIAEYFAEGSAAGERSS